MKSTTVYEALLREELHVGDRKWALPLAESQLIAIEEHGCYQGLLGAGQAGGNTQNSHLMGSLREKRRTAYYS